jgi:16S rRNA (uracil1498-N3)-methyltransferase
MTRLYVPCPLSLNTEIELPEEAAHHFIKVLRARVGEEVCLFNGEGGEYHGVLSRADKRNAYVTLNQFIANDKTSPLKVHLGQVLSRGERMDFAIQKATELGVTEITPLFSERCEVRLGGDDRQDKKLAHWQRVAISACEQCGLNRVPVIHPPQSLETWTQNATAELRFVLAPSLEGFPSATQKPQSVAVLIGSEGGLTEREINHAQQQGFLSWCLGQRVLRTETAPIAVLSVLHWLWGDFQ